MSYSTLEFLNSLDESKMAVSAKLIRDSLLNNTYPGRSSNLMEATSDIVSIELIKEPNGTGVSVKQADGHEYRYAADDTHSKYNTPEKLVAAAQKLLKYRKSGPVLGWLSQNAILYYGSKKEGNKDFPKESISKQVFKELSSLIKELHSEFSDTEVTEASEAFLEEFNIHSDAEYYRMGPNKIKNSL